MLRKRSVVSTFVLAGFALAGFGLSRAPMALAGAAQEATAPASKTSPALAHARIVRLSFLQGTASVRMAGDTKWIPAMVNAAIQEGFSIATDNGSFVEVEFENGSTVRMGERSQMDFTQLALTSQGGHINHMSLGDGYATFTVAPQRYDEYAVSLAGVTLTAQGKTQFRADVDQNHMRAEVFNGRVKAADVTQTETLTKNHALTLQAGASTEVSTEASAGAGATFQLVDKIEKDDWDKWTDAREKQSNLAYDEAAVTLGSRFYGWDDLDVYGEWIYLAGYGNAWAPYESAGWSPYQSGAWGYYPSFGYTWVSQEPWGWLPFHYGAWNYSVAAGWFWTPGLFNAWSPALVNWYSGPGWIGWVPVGAGGAGGRLPCTLAVSGCLIAVNQSVVSNGETIKPGSPRLVQPGPVQTFTPIARPGIAPTTSGSPTAFAAVRGGAPIQSGVERAPQGTLSASAAAPRVSRGVSAPAFSGWHGGAPASVIMGRQVAPQALVHGRSASGTEPIRVQMGGAIGGRSATAPAVGAGVREARGGAMSGGGPQVLARGSGGSGGGGFGSRGGGGGGGSVGVARSGGGTSSGSAGGSSGGGGGASRGASAPSGGGSNGSISAGGRK